MSEFISPGLIDQAVRIAQWIQVSEVKGEWIITVVRDEIRMNGLTIQNIGQSQEIRSLRFPGLEKDDRIP